MGQHWPKMGTGCRARSLCGMYCCAVFCSALDMEVPVSGEGSGKDSLGCVFGIALACCLPMRWVAAAVPPQKWSQAARIVSGQEPSIRSHCCPQGLQQGTAIQGL